MAGREVLSTIDAVIPIPETSLISAYAVSKHLKIPYCQGFVKNRYIFRTFIMPNQKARQKGVRAKLNAIPLEFEGKNVLLVDDSIVRGTTSREIVMMAKEAGAKKIYFSSCAPPITNAHIYGIDLASTDELIAHHRDSNDIAEHIGADGVIYQSLDDLKLACAELSPRPKQQFEVGVFCGTYVTPVNDTYFQHLERVRGETRRMKVMESAREAVRQGTAGQEEVRMAANGVEVDENGNVVPCEESEEEWRNGLTNGHSTEDVATARRGSARGSVSNRPGSGHESRQSMRQSQDISIHNLHDER